MRFRPLNSDSPFLLWPHFDPGQWIDFNPSLVQLPSGDVWSVIRRDRVPPVPGKGTVWAVRLDAELRPAGRPVPLVADGEDPRAVCVGDRVLVFYVLFERDGGGVITGTSMALAEFQPGSEAWSELAHYKLPKYPLGGAPADSHPGWEKNWVPFVLSQQQVGVIYSHDPWQIIVLAVGGTARHFEAAHRADGLRWAWGGIRGGTPPLPYPGRGTGGSSELITFFHSSEVVGSRKSYMVGACVFEGRAPFRPLLMTTEPLLVSPYIGGMHRHGWPVAASVIFPLGADAVDGGWRLLCGIDDGEIGVFTVPHDELERRLQPLPLPALPQLTHPGGASLSLDAPLLARSAGSDEPDWPLLRFLTLAAPRGRTLLDVGADGGLFMAGLAPGYRHVEAVATSAEAARWRARTVAINAQTRSHVHLPQGIAGALDEAASAVARPPWGVAALDEAGFADLDLVTLDVHDTTAVLQGLRHTLARDRPAMMLLLRADGSEHVAVGELLATLGYSPQAIFPRTPRAVLALHASRRDEIAWFV